MTRPITTVELGCVHCGGEDTAPLWSGREHEYESTTDATFHFVKCADCGLVRLHPRPDVSELPRIYPPEYYAYNLVAEDGSNSETLTDKAKMWMYQRRIMALIQRLGKDGSMRILDVGCGDGRLLDWYAASPAGGRLETHGIEMNEPAASVARRRGHRIVTGRFEADRELESGSFDLILASHVIEHVDDPRRFAERAAELLAPWGLFVVATPNWNSPEARRLAGHWGGNHFPRHWTLYDEKSVGALARIVDLELERIEYQPNPIFWVWSCHSWLRARFSGRRWPDRLFPPVGIFRPSLQSFVLLSTFTLLDLAMRPLTKRTGSMSVELRKPRS